MAKKHKILIVDDEEINREIIMEILDEHDEYVCEAAENGEQALQLVETFKPDIVLLDIMMPGMDGYSVCSKIRSNPRHKYIKIIMVSGKAMTNERLAGYGSGADDYLVKPFHADEILAKIRVFARLKQTEEVERLKSSVLSLFSHETKTPLNSVFMGCWHLLEDETLGESQKDTVQLILKSAKRLNAYVDKVYRLCQLKKGVQLNPMAISVSEFIEHTVKETEKNFQGKINFNAPKNNLKIRVDWRLFTEAFQAVLDNAVKFSPEGGEIAITCQPEENFIQIAISDQGNGIPHESLDSIFDEFSTGKLLSHNEGSGLSLAISRMIMEQHNGELTAENLSDKPGAAFKFRLPLQN